MDLITLAIYLIPVAFIMWVVGIAMGRRAAYKETGETGGFSLWDFVAEALNTIFQYPETQRLIKVLFSELAKEVEQGTLKETFKKKEGGT